MTEKLPHPENLRESGEIFKEYGKGSDAGLWKGWFEDADGKVTGFLAENGAVCREDYEGDIGDRTRLWNAARSTLMNAVGAPPTEGSEYALPYDAAAILSLALKAMRWSQPSGEVESARVEVICEQLDTLLGMAVGFQILDSRSPVS